MKKTIVCAVISVFTLAGCAPYVPLIDTRNVDMNAYHNDLRDCQ